MKKAYLLVQVIMIVYAGYSQTAQDYVDRGLAKAQQEDFYGAINELTKAIDLNPNSIEFYSNRAIIKLIIKDYAGVITDFTKIIELDPKSSNAYFNRGIAKGNLKDFRGAIADYNKVIEIMPKNAEAYQNRGLAKIKIGMKDSGCLDLSKAGEFGEAKAYDLIKLLCQ